MTLCRIFIHWLTHGGRKQYVSPWDTDHYTPPNAIFDNNLDEISNFYFEVALWVTSDLVFEIWSAESAI